MTKHPRVFGKFKYGSMLGVALLLNGKKMILLAVFAMVLVLAGQVYAQNPYAPNVTASKTTSVTVSGGSASVDDTSTTGVSVSITGASGVSSVSVTTQTLSAPSSGESSYSSSGVYLDVNVALPSGVTAPSGATVQVCFTDSSVTSSSTLHYWTGSSWANVSPVTVTGTQICGNVSLSALTGTNFVIAPAAANNTMYYIAAIVVALVVIIAVGIVLTRRKKA